MFAIHSFFTSIQGEGFYTGTPAIFLRMYGCPHCCSFCDTKDSWNDIGKRKEYSLEELHQVLREEKKNLPNVNHLVVTGGEPLYDENGAGLAELLRKVEPMFNRVQIETSGTEMPPGFMKDMPPCTYITISPKASSLRDIFFKAVRPELMQMADEFKFLIDDDEKSLVRIQNLAEVHPKGLRGCRIYLQPIDFPGDEIRTGAATTYAINLAKKYGWNLSCQIHKMLYIE